MWTCFKFWPMKSIFRKLQANESLIIACLQIYQELLSLMTFLWVHSNSKEVSYLSWQNTYSSLKATCDIKLKCFLWTKLLENLLLAKYLISCHCAFNFLKCCSENFCHQLIFQWPYVGCWRKKLFILVCLKPINSHRHWR